jgi:DNA-binding SARP family transcriptional activator/pimeloyl-ACP methyl ester carboxylesterase
LGPLRVERDGQNVVLGSAKQRLLLALLAAHPTGVSRARIIDALWPDEPPPSAWATALGYVSRLRAALGADAVETRDDGYRLGPARVDAREFERLLDGDPDALTLEQALALWEGDAFGDLADHALLVGEATRLHERRLDGRLRLAEIYLAAGDAARPTSMLEAVVRDSPLREDAWLLLVRALLDAGRSAEAVRAAHRCRRHLADIGLEPGPGLVAAEARALQNRNSGAVPAVDESVEVGPMRYARCGVHLAYQVVGGGPVDVVLSSYGSVSIDSIWDSEHYRAFVTRLASSCRVVLYDTRGVGLSDPIDVAHPPTIERQSDDLRCVLDTARAARAVVVGIGDGGPTAITYAHRHPSALLGLVLVNTFATIVRTDDYPAGVPRERFEANLAMSVDPDSGRDTSLVLRNHAPSVAGDAAFRRWWDRAGRRGASPATAAALWRVRYGADVRPLLPELSTPTLVIHRRGSRVVRVAHGAYLATHIGGARFVEVDGSDQPPFTEGASEIADLMVSFAQGLLGRRGS